MGTKHGSIMSPNMIKLIEGSGQTRREFENAPLRKHGPRQTVNELLLSKLSKNDRSKLSKKDKERLKKLKSQLKNRANNRNK